MPPRRKPGRQRLCLVIFVPIRRTAPSITILRQDLIRPCGFALGHLPQRGRHWVRSNTQSVSQRPVGRAQWSNLLSGLPERSGCRPCRQNAAPAKAGAAGVMGNYLDMRRWRKVTTWTRLQTPSTSNRLLPIPLVMPSSTAQLMGASNQAPAGTSEKPLAVSALGSPI